MDTIVWSLQVIPFHEQGFSSEEFQLLMDPCGSVRDCFSVKSTEPSAFRECTTGARELQERRKNNKAKGSISPSSNKVTVGANPKMQGKEEEEEEEEGSVVRLA